MQKQRAITTFPIPTHLSTSHILRFQPLDLLLRIVRSFRHVPRLLVGVRLLRKRWKRHGHGLPRKPHMRHPRERKRHGERHPTRPHGHSTKHLRRDPRRHLLLLRPTWRMLVRLPCCVPHLRPAWLCLPWHTLETPRVVGPLAGSGPRGLGLRPLQLALDAHGLHVL